ncbi:RING finger protein 222-like [Sphaeramia orbicularis]|uniref:RING finger protein 222-like n=1 Tax=Sphaeramia orbicularis TaxID=375764 RepID=UPI00117DDC9A|nr:RING finger protein 222-like [Sphaeramia orbicularis]
MALYTEEEEEEEEGKECPVCYEGLSGAERTLSCGHVFCHDCLVKTLVSVTTDGNIRDTIICPICRHLTFIKKQKEALASLTTDKDVDEGQTLEVPLPLPVERIQSARRASGSALPSGCHWIARCFRGISERVRRQRLVSPSHNTSQIFIISAQGRPMGEEDALSVVMTVVQPNRRRRRRVCTTARCLLVLLSAFTVLALVAATLPWILLA